MDLSCIRNLTSNKKGSSCINYSLTATIKIIIAVSKIAFKVFMLVEY